MLEFEMSNTQKAVLTAAPKKPKGGAAKLDGALDVELLTDGAGQAAAGDNDLSVVFTPTDDFVGDVNLRVSADADLGDGVETIEDLVLIHVTGEKAESLGLSEELSDK